MPVDVSGLTSGVTAIAAGSIHVCALTTGGGAKCWGDDIYSAIGDGINYTLPRDVIWTIPPTPTPTLTAVPMIISGNAGEAGATILGYANGTPRMVTADSGGNYTLTVPYNWSGSVSVARLGYTFAPVSRAYTNVISNQTAQDYSATLVGSISAGSLHTCWLKNDGTLACWGNNSHGESAPPTGATFTQVTSGREHSCALQNDGTLACWGQNQDGQATPPTGTAIPQVAGGADDSPAQQDNGTPTCC